jgi:hypothetical protein
LTPELLGPPELVVGPGAVAAEPVVERPLVLAAKRLEGRWNTAMTPPDVTGRTLVEVVQALLG